MKKIIYTLICVCFITLSVSAQSVSGSKEVCPLQTVRYSLSGVAPACSTSVQWVFFGPASPQIVGGGNGQLFVDLQFPNLYTSLTFRVDASYACNGSTGSVYLDGIKIKALPPANVINTSIPCVHTGNYVLQAPGPVYANYSTVQWTTNTGWPLISTDYSQQTPSGGRYMKATYNVTNSNGGYVKATYQSQCPNVPPSETQINISRSASTDLPEPTWISGPGHLCTGQNGTAAIQPYANAITYTWNSNQPTMKINGQTPPVVTVSPSVTISEATNSYVANVTVAAQTACGNTPQASMEVSVGFEGFQIGGEEFVCPGDVGFYFVNPIGNIAGVTYNWIVGGGTITSGQGTYKIRVRWGQGAGLTSVSCFMTKAGCTSYGVDKSVEILECFTALDFVASPNPARGSIQIALKEPDSQRNKVRPVFIEEVKILDKLGAVVHHQTFGKGSLKQTGIDISRLKPDVYILQVRSGNEWKAKQIVVQE